MKTVNQLITDMVEAIATIQDFKIPDTQYFISDGKTQDAVMFNLIIPGEASLLINDWHKEYHCSWI
jgi:uncharacterized protein with HEPN domain